MTEIEADIKNNSAAAKSAFPSRRGTGVGIAVVVLVAIAAGFLVWLLAIRDDDSTTKTANKTNAIAATVADLRAVATEVGHPVYWAGPSAKDTYELTKTRNGNIYIRYLPEDTELGDPRPKYTTIATYPSATAYATLEAGSHRKDATVYRFKSGALAVTYSKTPSSVFFAFPNSPYIVEVFDPSPARALKLVTSGQVKLIS
jgi:hypothetical protein